jgi:hypothetical protein
VDAEKSAVMSPPDDHRGMVNNLRAHERDFIRGEVGDLDLNQWATLI